MPELIRCQRNCHIKLNCFIVLSNVFLSGAQIQSAVKEILFENNRFV